MQWLSSRLHSSGLLLLLQQQQQQEVSAVKAQENSLHQPTLQQLVLPLLMLQGCEGAKEQQQPQHGESSRISLVGFASIELSCCGVWTPRVACCLRLLLLLTLLLLLLELLLL